MQPTDRPEFLKILNGLAAIKRVDLTPEALGMWWSAMGHWSLEEFRQGANHLVRTCQFMPSPYDFEQLRKAGRPTSAEAWQLAWQGNPTNDYAIRQALAAAAGNERLGMIDLDRLPWVEKRFREAYDELVDVVEHRDAVPQLADSSEVQRLGFTAGSALRRLS